MCELPVYVFLSCYIMVGTFVRNTQNYIVVLMSFVKIKIYEVIKRVIRSINYLPPEGGTRNERLKINPDGFSRTWFLWKLINSKIWRFMAQYWSDFDEQKKNLQYVLIRKYWPFILRGIKLLTWYSGRCIRLPYICFSLPLTKFRWANRRSI